MNGPSDNRYPGIRAFEETEQHLFFGRTQEARKLLSLVKAKSVVVLFAKSGIGKSSLISAGLIPLFDLSLYQPIKVRLQDTGNTPVDLIKKTLRRFLNEQKLTELGHCTYENARLWEFLRACEFGRDENGVIPLIVFDQFEEFFDHPAEERKILTSELSDLVGERLPERISERLRKIPRKQRTAAQLAFHSPLLLKVLFSIRSDKLSLMDEMSDNIPMILNNRYHLKPLSYEQAQEAIEAPAALQSDYFTTPPFSYRPETLELILNHLKNNNGEVESFQLQLLCQHIEKEVMKRHGSSD